MEKFLEDFQLSELKASVDQIQKYHIVGTYAPNGRRTMETLLQSGECQI